MPPVPNNVNRLKHGLRSGRFGPALVKFREKWGESIYREANRGYRNLETFYKDLLQPIGPVAGEVGDLLGSLTMLNEVARIAFTAMGQIEKPTMSDVNELRTSVAYAVQQKQQILRRLAQLAKTAPDNGDADPWALVDAALAGPTAPRGAQQAPAADVPQDDQSGDVPADAATSDEKGPTQ